MDFFKVRRFKKARKPKSQEDLEEKPIPHPEEPNNETNNVSGKSVAMDAPTDMDDDDDDFITNEVKRRLKELRRNSFMVLIPEEDGAEEEEEEEGETSSSEGRDIGTQVEHLYCDFESIYEKYCERMLFFDRMSAQQLNETGGMWCYLLLDSFFLCKGSIKSFLTVCHVFRVSLVSYTIILAES